MPIVENVAATLWIIKAVTTGAHAAKAHSNNLAETKRESPAQILSFLQPSFYSNEFARLAEEEMPFGRGGQPSISMARIGDEIVRQ